MRLDPFTGLGNKSFLLGGPTFMVAAAMEQIAFEPDKIPFAENPQPRCASVLLLDVSGSMSGKPLEELQAGLAVYRDELAADDLAKKRVEVAVITFGGTVDVVHQFSTADSFLPPSLTSNGDTPMGQAVVTGLDLLDQRKKEYRQNGIQYYRPWVFLITDGAPTDESTPKWAEAVERVHKGEEQKTFSFFAVGVEGANMAKLKELSKREPLKLRGLRFRDLFQWLSNSQQTVSRSNPDDSVPLKNPAAPDGWASV